MNFQCLIPMGVTSENVAERYGVDRTAQDTLAMHSHRNAAAAQQKGSEVPLSVFLDDKHAC